MKKNKLKNYCLLLLLISLSFSSCKEEKCYSCDDSINEWVKENKALIQSMDRSEMIKFETSKQRAIFRSLSAEKRKEIWIDKISSLEGSKLSDNEKTHFKIIESFIKELDFDKELTNKQVDYVDNWFDAGRKAFSWNDKFLVNSFYTIDNILKRGDELASDKVDCNCTSSSDCVFPLSVCSFTSQDCDKTILGCGLFWLYKCTGTCV